MQAAGSSILKRRDGQLWILNLPARQGYSHDAHAFSQAKAIKAVRALTG